MTNVNSLLKLGRHLGEGASTQHVGNLIEGRDLGGGLDNVQGVGVRAVSNAEAVNADSVVAGSDSCIDVGVVVVVVGDVPVRLVKADAVSENLNSRVRAGDIVGFAIFGADVVRALDILISSQRNIREVLTLLGEVQSEGGCIKVGLKDRNIKLALASIDVDGNSDIGADLGGTGQTASTESRSS